MVSCEQTAVVRRFNRSYTQRIGALEDSFLGLGLPLAVARVGFEIGVEPGTVQALRARLGLDSGQLSRILRRLERDEIVRVEPDPTDRRRRLVELTAAGRRWWDDLDRRSRERAEALLAPLTERQRVRLGNALREADLLVRASTVSLEAVDPASPEARATVAAYVAEMDARFDIGFDPGPIDADDDSLRPPDGVFVVARSDGAAVAGGGCRTFAGAAEIKRMWVDGSWRGAGQGARLLRRLEQEAIRLGHDVVRLDTRAVLTEAIALYERAGYHRIERYNDNPYATHFFAKDLRPGVPSRPID
ncbi:MAG: bifunctional helix-turn-helix transcriptional regulator/GNAT family N-acetyltransferase [Nocardioides sp.]|uniref:bifunctional helix-turn-helix transcriptional regulator/GNAT family N-acetyltransferase n=1 Tax=Nocardioides sp. TaxID=35761 RepID=UPI0039E2394D